MADIFQEVNEDLRQEKLETFWKNHGRTLIAAVVALVLATAFYSFYRGWDTRRNEAATQALIEAMSQSETAALSSYAAKTGGDHGALALLFAAGELSRAGKLDEARKLYQDVRQFPGANAVYRDLAVVMLATLDLNQKMDPSAQTTEAAEADRSSSTAASLETLANSSSPWRYSALELRMLTASRDGDFPLALELADRLAQDLDAPDSLRGRATVLKDLYRRKAGSTMDGKGAG